MSTTATNAVNAALDAHNRSIDTLHQQLASMPGVDKDKLQGVVDKFKSAAKTFHDDALACMH